MKLVHHNVSSYSIARDPDLRFELEVDLSPPWHTSLVAFVLLHGGSEVVRVQGGSVAELEESKEIEEVCLNPRLRWMRIVDLATGTVVRSKVGKEPWQDGDRTREWLDRRGVRAE